RAPRRQRRVGRGGRHRGVPAVAAGRRNGRMTATEARTHDPRRPREGVLGWLTSTDHKRIGLLMLGTATVLLLVIGALALTIRTQLARPEQEILSRDTYNQFFTMH